MSNDIQDETRDVSFIIYHLSLSTVAFVIKMFLDNFNEETSSYILTFIVADWHKVLSKADIYQLS